jgi:hypothetical protein
MCESRRQCFIDNGQKPRNKPNTKSVGKAKAQAEVEPHWLTDRRMSANRRSCTNLHLDAARARPAELLAPFAGAWARVHAVCLAAAACFPGARCVGVDVMVDPRRRPYVLECNPWGDYLPGLLIDGQDSYDLELRGLMQEAA